MHSVTSPPLYTLIINTHTYAHSCVSHTDISLPGQAHTHTQTHTHTHTHTPPLTNTNTQKEHCTVTIHTGGAHTDTHDKSTHIREDTATRPHTQKDTGTHTHTHTHTHLHCRYTHTHDKQTHT